MGNFSTTERDGHLFIVTINRPEVMNALHPPANAELSSVFDEFAADPDLWVAIITGAGERAFSAGNDLKYTAAGGDRSGQPATGFGGITSRFDLNKPLIAAVNGVAMGGGFEIALACDIIVAAENALFALPEVRVGLAALAGGVHRLPRTIGPKRALGMILTGRHVPAQEGYELGFVNEVVPEGQALAGARRWAERDPRRVADVGAGVEAGRLPGPRAGRRRRRRGRPLLGGRRDGGVAGLHRGPAGVRREAPAATGRAPDRHRVPRPRQPLERAPVSRCTSGRRPVAGRHHLDDLLEVDADEQALGLGGERVAVEAPTGREDLAALDAVERALEAQVAVQRRRPPVAHGQRAGHARLAARATASCRAPRRTSRRRRRRAPSRAGPRRPSRTGRA